MTTTESVAADAPAHRLNPGGRRMAHVVTWMLGLVTLGALSAGVPALGWAGRLAGLPGPAAYLVVAILDGSMVVLSLAAVVRRGRGERATWMWAATGALVIASAIVQGMHAWSVTGAATPAARVVAVAVGSAPPAIVLLATHAWLDLAVAPAPTRARRAAATRPARTTAPTPAGAVPTTPTGSVPAVTQRVVTDRRTPPRTTGRDGMSREAILEAALPLRAQGRSYQRIADELGISKHRVLRSFKAVTCADAEGGVNAAA